MKIKAVLMDMDGTLCGRSQVAVSVANMTAVQRAIEKGVHVIPCTGRVFNMLPPQLLTQQGLRYFVTCHGARAYDKELNISVYEDLISPENSSKLLKILEGKGLYNEIAANGTIYFEKAVSDGFNTCVKSVPEHHLWYVRDNCYTAVETPSSYFAEHGISIEKINLYDIPKELQQSIYDEVNATGFIKHTRLGAGPNLEFSTLSLNKLNATDAVLGKLGISYEETMAIGDSSSDFEILQKCGLGVAMGNAPDNIKAAANVVTGLNTEDGLAQAFEKYVL
ncbi:MAG: HAD-IIB family hydrolase [Clostridia bacterium]|nr:HAD-IIB family hydrolase [Clostridia bacterium]